MTVSIINGLVQEYHDLKTRKAQIEKRMKEVTKDIKDYLSKNVQADAKGNRYLEDDKFTFGTMARKTITLDQDKARVYFAQQGLLDDVLEVKTFVSEEKIAKLVANGLITEEDVQALANVKTTYAIDIKEKKAEEIVDVEVASSPKKKMLPKRK